MEEGFLFSFRRRRSVKPHFDTYDNGQKLDVESKQGGVEGEGAKK